MAGSTRQEREHRAMEEEIIATALAMVRAEGAANLSLREVAKRMEYSSAAIYRYFDDKPALVGTVIQRGFRELTARLQAVSTALPAEERLVALGQAYLSFAADEPQLYTLMFVNVLPGPTSHAGASLADMLIGDSAFSVLYNTVGEAITSGAFRLNQVDQLPVSIAAWALVHGYAMLRIRTPGLLTHEMIRLGLVGQVRGFQAGQRPDR